MSYVILLSLICGAITKGYHTSHKFNDIFWPKESFDYDERHRQVPLSSWVPNRAHDTYSPSPRDRDFYSYNSQGIHNNFGLHFDHQNGHKDPSVAWSWPKPTNSFSPYPFATGSQNNEHPVQSETIKEKPNSSLSTWDQKSEEINFNSPEDTKHVNEIPPTMHEGKNDNTTINNSDIQAELSDKKDIPLTDNTGNNIYVLQPNAPSSGVLSNNGQTSVPITFNSHKIELPSNQLNQAGNGLPLGNSVYVTIVANIPPNTPPVNSYSVPQNHEILNGQLTYIPLSANKLDPTNAENAMMTSVLNNLPLNNYTPIYLYANGQLILIPGFIINSQQNIAPKPNIEHQGLNIPSNMFYKNTQNQGYNPNLFQGPATATPISSGESKPQVEIQNFPYTQNPDSNSNLVYYGAPHGNNQNQLTNVNSPNNYPSTNLIQAPVTTAPITTDGSNPQLGNQNFQRVPNSNSNNNVGYYNAGPNGNNQNQDSNFNFPSNEPTENFYQAPANAAPITNVDSKPQPGIQNYQQVPNSNTNNNLGYYNAPHGNNPNYNPNGNYPNDHPGGNINNSVRPPPSWGSGNNVNVHHQPSSATKDIVEDEDAKKLNEEEP